jgi:hypothetical protein
MSNNTRKAFAYSLCSVYDNFDSSDFDVAALSNEIMRAFIRFGSDTPNNRNCFENIEYGSSIGRSNPDVTTYGFKVKGTATFVGHLLNIIESLEMPTEITEAYPDLTEEQWKAAMRMAVMVVQAFSPFKPIEE